ncbi:MAG: nucleotidyltransferase domain-containing protein [Lysobacteraceae bacterium]|jgi:predicted nucleotidyltransferase
MNPLGELRRVLEQWPGIRQAIVFGSMATGRATTDSDLDIALDLGRRMSADDRMALIALLAEASGRPVDLIDLHSVGEPLLGRILAEGKRLLGGDADHAELRRRHVFDSEDFMPYVRRMLSERRRQWLGMS